MTRVRYSAGVSGGKTVETDLLVITTGKPLFFYGPAEVQEIRWPDLDTMLRDVGSDALADELKKDKA